MVGFRVEFERVYMSALGFDSVFDKLRSLRMTGSLAQFNAEFNARYARCPPVPEESIITDYRRALPATLAAELERSRVNRFGGKSDWPALADIQSSAAALAATSPSWHSPPARTSAAFVPSSAPAPSVSVWRLT